MLLCWGCLWQEQCLEVFIGLVEDGGSCFCIIVDGIVVFESHGVSIVSNNASWLMLTLVLFWFWFWLCITIWMVWAIVFVRLTLLIP